MKIPSKWLIASSLLLSQAGFAQESPKEVTVQQIEAYKAAVETGCRRRGYSRGDEKAHVVCACIKRHLDANLSHAEWQQAYFFALKQKSEEEMQVFAPYLPALRYCNQTD